MNSKLTYWALCLSIVAIVMTSIIIICWIVKAGEVAAVSLDTFIGVIVSLMALLVTIVLGWQIYNSMEIKEKINASENLRNDLETLKTRLEQSKKNIENSNIYNAFYHSTLMGLGAAYTKDYITAFRFLQNALYLSLQAEKVIELKATLSNLLSFANSIESGQEISQTRYGEINEVDKKIRSSKQYDLCKDDYENSYNMYISKVRVSKV